MVSAATQGLSSDMGMRVESPTLGAHAPSSHSDNLGHPQPHKVSTRKWRVVRAHASPTRGKTDPRMSSNKGPNPSSDQFPKHQRSYLRTKPKLPVLLTSPYRLGLLTPLSTCHASAIVQCSSCPNMRFLLCFQVSDQAVPLPRMPSHPCHLAKSSSSFRSQTLLPLGSLLSPQG